METMSSAVRRPARPAAARSRRTGSPARRLQAVLAGLTVAAGLALSACDAAGEPTAIDLPDPGSATGEVRTSAAPSPTATADPSTPPAETTGSTATESAGGGEDDPSESVGEPAEPTSVPTFAGTATDAPAADGVPGTYAEARARIDTLRGSAGTPAALSRFSTPGDAVHCVLGDEVLGTACELRRGIRDPEVCSGALGDAVGRIELIRAGAVPQCNTDTIREPGARVVRPAGLVARAGVVCAVERIGVTCVEDARDVGFFLAPGRYATFG